MIITIIKNVFKIKQNNLIKSYLNAIDNKNTDEIKQLTLTIKSDENKNEKDIVYEMYNNYQLSNERLLFIIENCTSYLNISSRLMTTLMKDNNKKLLETIFEKQLKFFDNEIIMNLLFNYKNKIPIPNSALYEQINNDKYKLSTELNRYIFDEYDSSYYLFNACLLGNESMVKYLVEHGADITIKDNDDRMAFSKACESGNEHLVRYLVRIGADINHENYLGVTPIFNACVSGNENIVKYLVELGADINKENKLGRTPLLDACSIKIKNKNIVKCLVEHGADINKKNYNGNTPLFVACYNGYEDTVKYLVEHGLDINKRNWEGKTPLFNAYKKDHKNIVKYLIEHGADIKNAYYIRSSSLYYFALRNRHIII